MLEIAVSSEETVWTSQKKCQFTVTKENEETVDDRYFIDA